MAKNSQVNVNVNASATAQAASQSAAVTAPSPENTIRRLVNRFNLPVDTQRALPEPKEHVPATILQREAVTVDAEYDDD